jgi:DNA-directed RNA polymerase subunit RPC12/RpoP
VKGYPCHHCGSENAELLSRRELETDVRLDFKCRNCGEKFHYAEFTSSPLPDGLKEEIETSIAQFLQALDSGLLVKRKRDERLSQLIFDLCEKAYKRGKDAS